jgi:hypothetical protein
MTTAEALELARETLHEGPHTTAYWIDRADILARALIDLVTEIGILKALAKDLCQIYRANYFIISNLTNNKTFVCIIVVSFTINFETFKVHWRSYQTFVKFET